MPCRTGRGEQMALPGRKRKQGERRNGRVISNERPASVIRRLLEQHSAGARDLKLGTIHGRWHVEGFIDSAQFTAASRFGESQARADSAQGLQRNPKALQYEYASQGQSARADDPEADQRAVERHDNARRAIGLYTAELRAVEGVIANELPGDYFEKLCAKRGFQQLVHHWDIKG